MAEITRDILAMCDGVSVEDVERLTSADIGALQAMGAGRRGYAWVAFAVQQLLSAEDMPNPVSAEEQPVSKDKRTSVMKAYDSIKEQHPDRIVFFRLGDFYETFGKDAELMAESCDLALTSRPAGKDERIPMAGFPHHALEQYTKLALATGFSVVIAVGSVSMGYETRIVSPAHPPDEDADEEVEWQPCTQPDPRFKKPAYRYIRKADKMPDLYAQDELDDEALVYVKLFMHDGWTWYITEYDGHETAFGLVDGFALELGYIHLPDIMAVRSSLNLPIERDLHFKPMTLGEVREMCEAARRPAPPKPEPPVLLDDIPISDDIAPLMRGILGDYEDLPEATRPVDEYPLHIDLDTNEDDRDEPESED